MDERKLVHPSCKYCTPLAYHEFEHRAEMERYFCFGKRNNPSPAEPSDEFNFCIYTPFKGVIQFHVQQADIELWMALFLAAWMKITDLENINWSVIGEMTREMVGFRGGKVNEPL